MASLPARLLEHRRAPLVITALAVLLVLPTLASGFYSDDFAHLTVLEGLTGPSRATPLDLYRFVGADRAELHDLIVDGPLPWWSSPALKLHFFRPLSSGVIALSHALFGRVAPLHHLVSVVCYAALVLAVASFHRRVLPGDRAVAVLATLLFAIDGHHAQSVGWIAGRHQLVAAIPAVLGLAAHLRAVHEGFRPGRWLGPLGLAIGLLGGESALGILVYWLAHDWLSPGLERRARLRASLPVLVLAAAYSAFYKLGGHGAAGSGGYLDPLGQPAAFAAALPGRLGALLADAFTRFPAEAYHVAPHALLIAIGLGSTALTILFYLAVRPAIPAAERAALRWLLPGALGALLVGAGSFVGGRILLVPVLGGAVLLAVLLRRGVERVAMLGSPLARLAIRGGLAWLVLAHLVVGPISLITGGLTVKGFAEATVEAARTAEVDGPPGRSIVVLAASDPGAAFYTAVTLAPRIAREARWHVASMARHTHRFTRTGPTTLRIDILGGHMLEGAFETLFRAPSLPLHEGDRVELHAHSITVLAVDHGAPTSIEARFDLPLEDPHLVLLAWRDNKLGRIPHLAVGESFEVPWSPGPFRMF